MIVLFTFNESFVAYVSNLHPLEHKGPFAEDKFYLRPSGHVTVHGGAIPIQQPPQVLKQYLYKSRNMMKNNWM